VRCKKCGRVNIINQTKVGEDVHHDVFSGQLMREKIEFIENSNVECVKCGNGLPL